MTEFVASRVLLLFVIIVSYFVDGTPSEVLAGQKCSNIPGCEIYQIKNGRSDEGFIAFYNGIIYEYADVDESLKQKIRSSMWKKNCNRTREARDRDCSCSIYNLENGQEQVNYEERCDFTNERDDIVITYLPIRALIVGAAQTRANCRNGEKELTILQKPEKKLCKIIETAE